MFYSFTSKKTSFTSACALLLLICGTTIGPAQASTVLDQNLDYIVSSAGADSAGPEAREEIIQALHDYAHQYGMTFEQAAQHVADESRSYTTTSLSSNETPSDGTAPQSSQAQKIVALQQSKYIGDIFYSSNSTLGIQHGHTGIYYSDTHYVEAAGFSAGVRSAYAGNANSPAPAHKYFVGWD